MLTASGSTLFWALSTNFWFYGKVSPPICSFSTFGGACLGKIGQKFVLRINSSILDQIGWNFGQFWLYSALWSVWDRFQRQQRCYKTIFSLCKFEKPLGPSERWSCIELYLIVWGEKKIIFNYFLPSELNGRGFKTIWGLLQPKILQMSSKSHEGLVEEGTVYDNSSLFSEYGKAFL